MYNNLHWSKVTGELKGDPNDDYIKQGKDVPLDYFTKVDNQKVNIPSVFLRVFVLNWALNSWRMRQGLSIPSSKYREAVKAEKFYSYMRGLIPLFVGSSVQAVVHATTQDYC